MCTCIALSFLISILDCHDKHKAGHPSDAEIDNILCQTDNQDGLICVEFQGASSAIHISNKRRNLSVLTSKKRLQMSGKYLPTYSVIVSCLYMYKYVCMHGFTHIICLCVAKGKHKCTFLIYRYSQSHCI